MKTMLRDAHAGLLRAMRQALAAPGDEQLPGLTIESVSTVAWASATFAGQRHVLQLRLRGSSTPIDGLLDRLAALDADVPGHVLIDLAVADVSHDGPDLCLTVEALTLED